MTVIDASPTLCASPATPTSQKITVVILGASFSTGNHGVSALASGTIASVLNCIPNADIRVLDYGKDAVTWREEVRGTICEVPRINLRFSKRILTHNNIAFLLLVAAFSRLIPIRKWRVRWLNWNPTLQQIAGSEQFLSLAGGDSFSDIYGLGRFFYVSLPQLLILTLGKPLILLPQTYGPFKSLVSRKVARLIVYHASRVYSRDIEGLSTAIGLSPNAPNKPKFAYDMGFALEPLAIGGPIKEELDEIKGQNSGAPLVGFNISGLLLGDSRQARDPFGLKADYSQIVEAAINELLSRSACRVLLIAHVYCPEEQPECDIWACKEIISRLRDRWGNRLRFLPNRFSHRETKFIIGQCDFFVGSRMHACIAALSQSIPAVALAYSGKFAGVMNTVGEGAIVVDLRTTGIVEVVERLHGAFLERERLRSILRQQMPAIRHSVLTLFRTSQ